MFLIQSAHLVYVTLWITVCLYMGYLIWIYRTHLIFFKRTYIHFLFQRWKLVTWAIALAWLCGISLLGYDPTWDVPISIIMSVGIFYFAPYSVGIIYRFLFAQQKHAPELTIALVLLCFVSCWVYEAYSYIYLLWHYPPTVLGNMMLSPMFYVFWWMVWSLDYSKQTGVIFVYTQQEWIEFSGEPWNVWKIIMYCMPILLCMCGIFGLLVFLMVYGY